jgi:hypothetical protein
MFAIINKITQCKRRESITLDLNEARKYSELGFLMN